MFLPRTCPLCHRPAPAPCASCVALLKPSPSLPPPPSIDRCHALLAYEGPARDVVARIKYRNERSALAWLARGLAGLVDPGGIDVVTWLPTTDERRRTRGFDQSALLARAVAHHLRRPCRRLLVRHPGPAQTGRPAAERRVGPRLDARRTGHRPVPARVLVVDDVVTTGSSATAAALALRRAGAVRVVLAAAARTPARVPRACGA
jgi:predicted amidophosphoribosyltransferase